MSQFNTIVLGLGAMGSATVYQLARRGSRVLGIDQFSPPHVHGSTHGDTRITRLAIGEGEHYTPLALRSHELWRDIERETGTRLLHQTGGLIISSPCRTAQCHVDGFFENTLAAARHFSIPHEVLDGTEIPRRFPQLHVRPDDRGYYEPEAGYVRPEACVRAQLDLAARHGAELRLNERVTAFRETGEGVEVRTQSGSYAADRLVITAGPWLPGLLGEKYSGHFRVTRQVLFWFEIRRYTERFSPDRCPVFICQMEGAAQAFYGFPAVDGPGGGIKIATEQEETVTTPEVVERTVSETEIGAMYRDYVARWLPDLGERCLRAVTCLYTQTPDCGFAIDVHPEFRRVMIVSPCSGHGFKHSAALGEAICQLVLDGRSRVDLSPFGLGRFNGKRSFG